MSAYAKDLQERLISASEESSPLPDCPSCPDTRKSKATYLCNKPDTCPQYDLRYYCEECSSKHRHHPPVYVTDAIEDSMIDWIEYILELDKEGKGRLLLQETLDYFEGEVKPLAWDFMAVELGLKLV